MLLKAEEDLEDCRREEEAQADGGADLQHSVALLGQRVTLGQLRNEQRGRHGHAQQQHRRRLHDPRRGKDHPPRPLHGPVELQSGEAHLQDDEGEEQAEEAEPGHGRQLFVVLVDHDPYAREPAAAAQTEETDHHDPRNYKVDVGGRGPWCEAVQGGPDEAREEHAAAEPREPEAERRDVGLVGSPRLRRSPVASHGHDHGHQRRDERPSRDGEDRGGHRGALERDVRRASKAEEQGDREGHERHRHARAHGMAVPAPPGVLETRVVRQARARGVRVDHG